MSPVVNVSHLSKHYQVPEREAAAQGLFKRRFRTVKAVDKTSFHIQPGEAVGFLGPNDAGKTTTLKMMLSGLLHPTGGSASVLDFEPARRSHDYLLNGFDFLAAHQCGRVRTVCAGCLPGRVHDCVHPELALHEIA